MLNIVEERKAKLLKLLEERKGKEVDESAMEVILKKKRAQLREVNAIMIEEGAMVDKWGNINSIKEEIDNAQSNLKAYRNTLQLLEGCIDEEISNEKLTMKIESVEFKIDKTLNSLTRLITNHSKLLDEVGFKQAIVETPAEIKNLTFNQNNKFNNNFLKRDPLPSNRLESKPKKAKTIDVDSVEIFDN